MNRYLRAGFLVFAVLFPIAGEALAGKTVIRAKGAEAGGSFDREEVITCADGSTALRSTFLNIAMFEGSTTANGESNTALQTTASVTRFDGCTFLSTFDFGLFEGVGSLQVTALKAGRMTGLFTLNGGTALNVDLTLSGTDEISSGMSSQRTILGRVMTLQRSKGKSCTAILSGSVTLDGQTITSAQMDNPSGHLASNTGGEITILKP